MAAKRKCLIFMAEQVVSRTENWCVTKPTLTKYYYEWTVANFSFCSKMRQNLNSSTFGNYYRWHLQLYLANSATQYSLEVNAEYIDIHGLKSEVKFYFMNGKREKAIVVKPKTLLNFTSQANGGFTHYFTKDDLLKANLLAGDKLTICVELTIISDKQNITEQTNDVKFAFPPCKLKTDLAKCLTNPKFSDVTILVNGHEFKAHKAILAIQSDVFANIFEMEMKENDNNSTSVTDIDHEAFKQMLNFIYTGTTPNVEKITWELLKAADKYALKQLKVLCEEALCRNLCTETAAEILLKADLYDGHQLKLQTIEFIKANASHIRETQNWQNLIKDHPQLITKNGLEI